MGTFAALHGRPLFPWQRAIAEVALERGRWRWRYPLVNVLVPRQSGKTTLVSAVALHRCYWQPEAQVWYTAQSRMDAVLRWREMVRLLRRGPLTELPSKVVYAPKGGWDYRVRGSSGAEVIAFRNGSELRVFSPLEDSLHGSVTDLVILDEARFFDEAQGNALMAAVMPTQATTDGQVWITSTAGGPESVFLDHQMRAGRAALAERGARRAHGEWGIGEGELVTGGDLLERVWAAHPSAGLPGGLRRDALAVAADSMPAWQFAHEFGNRWRLAADERLLPAWAWDRAKATEPMGEGEPTFGVDVALDRSQAAIVVAVGGVCQLVELHPGAWWVANRAAELHERWPGSRVWVDGAGPAGSVADALRPTLGEALEVTSMRELVAACGAFYDALLTDPPEVFHRPAEALDQAVAQAKRRPLGQAWAFDRIASGPALMAMVLAWFGDRRRATAEAAVVPPEPPMVFA